MKFILLGLLSLFAASSATISNCGINSAFTITELAQSPDTYMSPGTNVTLKLTYSVPKEVLGGTATTSASLNGLPLTPTTEDLCSKVACPIEAGEHNGDSWFTFPSGVSGKITSQVVWRDSAGTELLCLNSVMKTTSQHEHSVMGDWVNTVRGVEEKSVVKVRNGKHLRHS